MKSNKQQPENRTKNFETIILPHNREVERATVGAMLIEKTAVYEVIDFLKPEMFYDIFLKSVYEAVLAVESNSQVDIYTVAEEMKKRNEQVNLYDLATLSEEVASAAHIGIHARIVYQDYLRRTLMITCAQTLAEANDMSVDVADLIDKHTVAVEEISNRLSGGDTVSVSKVTVESFNSYKEREEKARQGIPIGIHTGLKTLDKALHGFQRGSVYILAARPAMGKTAFMLNIARKTAKHGNNVVVFSLEMTKRSLVDRMVIAESGINASEFRSGRLSPEEFLLMAEAQERISILPLEINDNSSMSIQRIKAEARRLKRKGKCDIIMIDYLQLMDTQALAFIGKTKNDEVAALSRSVKIVAKDLDIPVVILSQLNRDPEKRADKIPMLSDLRDSGAIEQDADVVMFIHREAYYTDSADRSKGIIRIAKSREERTGDVDFYVNENITDFRDEEFSKPVGSYSQPDDTMPF